MGRFLQTDLCKLRSYQICEPQENQRIRIIKAFHNFDKYLKIDDLLIVKHSDNYGIVVNKETEPWERNYWILPKNFYNIEIVDMLVDEEEEYMYEPEVGDQIEILTSFKTDCKRNNVP